MRLLWVVALTFSFGVLAGRAQDPKKDEKKDAPPENPRAEKFKEIKKKYNEEFGALGKKFGEAKEIKDKEAIRTEAKELSAKTAGAVVKFAEENPKDDVALEAVEFTVRVLSTFRQAGPDLDKATAIALDNHLGNPKIKNLVMMMSQAGPGGQKFLKAVAEKGTDKDARGTALFFIGSSLVEEADDATDPKKVAALNAEAVTYFEKAIAAAPDARVNQGTIKKSAEEEITAIKTLAVGLPAPEVESNTLDGKKARLSEYKGRVVLIDVWATWCGPCKAMIPHERDMVEKLKGKPFALVSVSADRKKETLEAFLEKEKMPWNHWWDGVDGAVLKTYRVKAYPTMYLIDAKGVIRKKWIGSPGPAVLDKAIEELVAEAEKTKG